MLLARYWWLSAPCPAVVTGVYVCTPRWQSHFGCLAVIRETALYTATWEAWGRTCVCPWIIRPYEWSRMPGDGAVEWRTARVTGVVSAQLRLLLNWLCLTGSDRLVMLTAIPDESVPQTSPWRTVCLHVGTCLSEESTFNVGFEKTAATDFFLQSGWRYINVKRNNCTQIQQ